MNNRVIGITLGSNGFHLHDVELQQQIKGQEKPQEKPQEKNQEQELTTHEHLYQAVQAQSYVNESGEISAKGIGHILIALENFAEYLKKHPDLKAGGIATGTFRQAKNSEDMMRLIDETLGFPVKLLSGQDESMLCYLGIASSEGFVNHNRLVIDIGGGSTELILAKQNQMIHFTSLDTGCVSLSERASITDTASQKEFDQAVIIAKQDIASETDKFKQLGWQEVMACGGTVSSLFALFQRNRYCGRFFTPASLQRFQAGLVESDSVTHLGGADLPIQRARVLPGGAALLLAIIETLEIEKVQPVFSSVGQGLIIQLLRSNA